MGACYVPSVVVGIRHTKINNNKKNLCPNKVCHLIKKINSIIISKHQFSSVARSCPTLCNPMNRSTLGLRVHHQLPEFTQTHIQLSQ